MRRFWGWLGLNLGKRAGVVAMVGLLVTLLFGFGVTKLRFTTTNADYLNPHDPAWLANVAYEKNFGGDPMLVMFTMKPGYTVDDMLTPANIKEFQRVGAALSKDKWVFSYVTPLDAMSLSQVLLSSPDGIVLDSPGAKILENAVKRDPNPASQAKRFKYLSQEGTLESSFSSSQQVLSNPKWMHFLLHEPNGQIRQAVKTFVPNPTHALLAVYLQGNISVAQEGVAATSVTNILDHAQWQNMSGLVTGVPELIATINNYLKHGVVILGGIAAVLMLSILALSFNVRWRFLAFAIVAVGAVWGFGLVAFFGIPLTLATIAALPTLLGIGMDYSIQMHSRIEEEVVLARSPHPVQASARGLGPALLVVTFDAVFAFMAMWFAKTPAIREFGSLLVVGIIAVCVCSIILTLATLGIREYRSPTKGKDFSHGLLSRLVAWLSSVPRKFALPFAIASIAVFLGGIVAEGHLHIQTDAISWVNPHSQAIKDLNAVKAGTGSANEIAVNLETNQPFSDRTVDYVVQLSNHLQSKYNGVLLPATGLISTLDQVLNSVPGTSHVNPTGAQVEGLYLASTPGIRRTLMANGGRSINIIFRAIPNTLSSLEPVVTDLEGGIKAPSGIHIAPGGIAIVGVGLIENIEKSRVELTYLAILFVGAFLAVRLRSLLRAVLSLVPVLTAVGAVSLVAVAFNLKLSPVTAVAGPLVVAVCTEFTSLILLRFVEERQRGYSPRRAMDATARRTGRAFMVSGLTAVAGIATLATSSMPLLSDFGTIVALNVTVALLAALVVLPPILVAAEQRGWVTRGLLYAEEVPFIEYDSAAPPGPAAGAGDLQVAPEPARALELVPAAHVPAEEPGTEGAPPAAAVSASESVGPIATDDGPSPDGPWWAPHEAFTSAPRGWSPPVGPPPAEEPVAGPVAAGPVPAAAPVDEPLAAAPAPPPPQMAPPAPPPMAMGSPPPMALRQPPPGANGDDAATEPVHAVQTATVGTPEDVLAALMDRTPATRPRQRGGRLAAIAARLVGMNDR